MQAKRKVLVVGGYGAVGGELCRALARDERVDLIVAGRRAERARALAESLGASWREIDANNPESGLDGVEAIVNCFVDTRNPSFALPAAATGRGLSYLDLAGVPVSYTDRFQELDARAAAGGATLSGC